MIVKLKQVINQAKDVLGELTGKLNLFAEAKDITPELDRLSTAKAQFNTSIDESVERSKVILDERLKVIEAVVLRTEDAVARSKIREEILKEIQASLDKALVSANAVESSLSDKMEEYKKRVIDSNSELQAVITAIDEAIEKAEARVQLLRESFGDSAKELEEARRERSLATALRREIGAFLPYEFSTISFYDCKEEMLAVEPECGQLAMVDDILYRYTDSWKVASKGLFNATLLGGYTVSEIIRMARS